jgi:hypothetical protein
MLIELLLETPSWINVSEEVQLTVLKSTKIVRILEVQPGQFFVRYDRRQYWVQKSSMRKIEKLEGREYIQYITVRGDLNIVHSTHWISGILLMT